MTADARPPPAIRITRPYATEEEFLERELETLSRTGVTLIGAQPRAEGVVLRFELVLSTGQVLVRGEGRVVGFKAGAQPGTGGLALRFTRLDARSKALIDKAAALREQRRPSLRPPSMAPPSMVVSAPSMVMSPPSLTRASAPPPGRRSTPPPPPVRLPRPPSIHDSPPPSEATMVGTPLDRNALLSRLRARAAALAPETVESIFEQRRRALGEPTPS